jgi:hypothetical protein
MIASTTIIKNATIKPNSQQQPSNSLSKFQINARIASNQNQNHASKLETQPQAPSFCGERRFIRQMCIPSQIIQIEQVPLIP